jgi:hypothetical protein
MVAGFFQADHPSNRVDLMHVENRINYLGDALLFGGRPFLIGLLYITKK